MKFKKGDIVFFKNRTPIEWERGFNLAPIFANRLYSVNIAGKIPVDGMHREFVQVFDTSTQFHTDHFQLVEGDEVQGIPLYKSGEMIECVDTKPVDDWEAGSYSIMNLLSTLNIGEKYRVDEFIFSNGTPYIRINTNLPPTWVKINHFKR